MNHSRRLRFHLFATFALALASCVSTDSRRSSLTARVKTAEQAYENGSVNKAELLKVLLETDLERGRLAYHKQRFMMARSPSAERLHDPPRHYKRREMVKQAKDAKEISEQTFNELNELIDKAQDEWLARRQKVMRDRAIWGFPR